MNPLQRLISVFRPATPKAQTRLTEAAGVTVDVDADEDDWRRLSGDCDRDLSRMTQDRMQRIAHFLWESNLIANRLIELPVAYMLAKGVKWRVDDPDAQRLLDRHWKDGINAWNMKLPKRVRELALFGEQCYPVFRGSAGFVRIGYLDPAMIETVVPDPENREQPIGIITRKNRKGEARRYRVIVNVPETAFAERTREIRESFTDGDCFYFRVNDLCSSTRGRSDLLAQADWIDAYDQFLYGELDRAGFMRAFVWDVTMTGATEDEIKTRAKKITAPRPNSVRVHNEGEKWEPKAPSLQAADATAAARLFRNHVLGGATVPEHWYGGAADVNRATGESMAEPTEKNLDMRRSIVGYMLESIGLYVLRSAWNVDDASELSEQQATIADSLRVEWPEMSAKDTTKYASALQQVVSACAQALSEKLLSRETALRVIAAMADRLGVEIDPETELEAALNDPTSDLGRDAFNPPADDGEGAAAAA